MDGSASGTACCCCSAAALVLLRGSRRAKGWALLPGVSESDPGGRESNPVFCLSVRSIHPFSSSSSGGSGSSGSGSGSSRRATQRRAAGGRAGEKEHRRSSSSERTNQHVHVRVRRRNGRCGQQRSGSQKQLGHCGRKGLCFAPLPPTQPASVHSSRRGSDAGSLDTRSSVSRGSVMDLLANSRPPRLDLRVDLGARCSAVVAAFAVFVRPAVGRRFCWSEREPSSAVGTPQLRSVFSCGLDLTQCGD